ncbi:hypothetical protein TPHA_0F03350 [Tetrapisispora phaffii CBS 4417]|uniref:NAD+ kinase n=1 Tax=Tetrapisispora phaffii (strain ATCC 24235 / CBS 4417 / NBRC 1672 / NRRL Y-8282 / UCD 70-5) TaxID=1071381 RepID=G8BUN0_TETPH|nr:hypothetical protein TPHA_0F03350 [Tetrapisispora phaffii CBS 4417]CCE63816.1 hypothetical protein TPHA_0F03350 [Tetrapisispora phaffii CBS 4417]
MKRPYQVDGVDRNKKNKKDVSKMKVHWKLYGSKDDLSEEFNSFSSTSSKDTDELKRDMESVSDDGKGKSRLTLSKDKNPYENSNDVDDDVALKQKNFGDDYEGCIVINKKIEEHNSTAKETAKNSLSTSKSMPDVSKMKAAIKPHFKYASHAYGLRMMSKKIFNTKVELDVENIMIVIKNNDVSLIYLLRELIEWLLAKYPALTVYIEDKVLQNKSFDVESLISDIKCPARRIKFWNVKFLEENIGFFDLVITLGGDGTVLFVSSIFQTHVPPVLSFSLGSLGFLTNYKFEHFKKDLSRILNNNKVKTNLRMRLECKVYRRREPVINPETGKKLYVSELISEHHVLNELTVDRGPSPFISNLELYNDCSLLTVAQADGLIISTPTGSTAYSLSAGGSLVYPSVNAIAVTPICPHTLNFRPIILPDSVNLRVKVSMKSRATAWAAFDGKNRVELFSGDYISISASPYAFPTIESSPDEFINSINRTLNWNLREEQKSFTHMLSDKNKEKYANDPIKLDQAEESCEEVELQEKIDGSKIDIAMVKHMMNPERKSMNRLEQEEHESS